MNILKNIFGHTKWSASASVFTILLQAALYFVITRYISTEDLGLYALASSFIFIGITILDNCFTSSLIHKGDPQIQDYYAIFTLNVIAASILILLALIFALIFDLIYHGNRIIPLVLCLSPLLYLSAFNSINIAKLKLQLSFKILAIIEIISIILFFTVAVTLSFLNLGYWSLIIAMLVKYITIFLILLLHKEPLLLRIVHYNADEFKQHWDYGKFIIGEKGLSSIFAYSDIFLINHFLGLDTLGIYDVLKKIVVRPLILLYNSIEQVLFPILSKYKSDPEEYLKSYKSFMNIIVIIYVPLISLLLINRHFLLGFFPEQYTNRSILMALIIVMSASIILLNPLDIILYSANKTRQFFNWFVVTNIILLFVMFYFVRIDIEQFVAGIAIFNFIIFPMSYFILVKKHSPLDIHSFLNFLYWIIPIILLISFLELYLNKVLYLSLSNILIFLIGSYLFFNTRKTMRS